MPQALEGVRTGRITDVKTIAGLLWLGLFGPRG
jgi:hypothetical protein